MRMCLAYCPSEEPRIFRMLRWCCVCVCVCVCGEGGGRRGRRDLETLSEVRQVALLINCSCAEGVYNTNPALFEDFTDYARRKNNVIREDLARLAFEEETGLTAGTKKST